ncbi:hypothetical protein BDM02DRAFT_3121361 [Thelephora ganbajun]|uniref:Uncharacterized protein n=1 Tax=Thelephora ganbajun TaxID=370292 RepID=A0ACB6Z5E0_THEGA|nr:hypothetical protein BDM02DRAFT_3121361 [Thelephora ganbajun]
MACEHLRFGVEAKFLLIPRDAPEFKNTKAFAKWVLQGYQGSKQPAWSSVRVDLEGSYSGKSDNLKIEWPLSDDGSMHLDHDPQYPTQSCSLSRYISSAY